MAREGREEACSEGLSAPTCQYLTSPVDGHSRAVSCRTLVSLSRRERNESVLISLVYPILGPKKNPLCRQSTLQQSET